MIILCNLYSQIYVNVTVQNITSNFHNGNGIFYNGSVTITASGGIAPYNYKLVHYGSTYPSVTNGYYVSLDSGVYLISVTDASGQLADTSITIHSVYPIPTLSIINEIIPSTCGSADGSFTLVGSGGTPPYTYSIDGGITYTSNNTFTNLTSGIYNICLVKDANGMLATASTGGLYLPDLGYFGPICTFGEDAGPGTTAASCTDNRSDIGAVSFGGLFPIQFSIDGIHYFEADTTSPSFGKSGHVFDSVGPGLHHIYAKDASGAIDIAASIIVQYCYIKITYIGIVASCDQNDGEIIITASNGTPPYTYTMDGIHYQTSNTFTGLGSGLYTISVKDADNAFISGYASVYDKCPIVAITDTNETCSNSNASIIASGTNGTRPYQYSIDGVNYQTDSLFSGLSAGNYKIILKDANGYKDSITTTITNSCLLVFGVSTDKTCGIDNGTITVNGTGGTPTYLYSKDGINFQHSNVFNGLDSGTYTISIEDSHGLVSTTKIIVNNTPFPILNLGNDTTLCSGQTLDLIPNISGSVISYSWQNGSANNNYLVSQTGQYWVRINLNGCTVSDTINVAYISLSNKIFPASDTTLCIGNSIILNAGNPGSTYVWDDNSNQQVRTINSSGKYWVTVNTSGCSVSDTIICHFISGPLINLGNDTVLCNGQKLIIVPRLSNASYLWSNNTTADSLLINQAGNYWLTATANGCSSSDTMQVAYNPAPSVFLGNDTSVCIGNTVILKAPISTFYQYLWQDNSTANNYIVTTTGVYSLKVTNQFNCSTTDSILIHFNPIPVFSLGNDTSLCNGKSLNLQTSLVGSYLWNTGSTASFLNINTGGLYWLQVTQLGCTKTDSIEVSYKSNPFIDLGDNVTLCDGRTLLLNVTTSNGNYLWQDGSSQPTYLVHNAGIYSVKVTVDGCDTTGQLEVNYISMPSINLGNDTTICMTEKLLLNANFPQSSYLWQDGSIQSTYNVTKEGKYLVSVTNTCGTSSDSINVEYQNCACEFYVPSAFSPNNDSKNDIFKPVYQCLFSNYSLSIYNRYGQLIFESQNPDLGWNGSFYGQPQDEGVYVWMIKYLDSVIGRSVTKKGNVVLIR